MYEEKFEPFLKWEVFFPQFPNCLNSAPTEINGGVFLQWEQDWTSHKALSKSTSNVLNWECAFTIIMSQNGWRIQLYWICADGLLRHLLELWLFPFFFLLPNGICAKTSHHAAVSCLQWVTNLLVCKSEQQAESLFLLCIVKKCSLIHQALH